jgi:hypothetical protein
MLLQEGEGFLNLVLLGLPEVMDLTHGFFDGIPLGGIGAIEVLGGAALEYLLCSVGSNVPAVELVLGTLLGFLAQILLTSARIARGAARS